MNIQIICWAAIGAGELRKVCDAAVSLVITTSSFFITAQSPIARCFSVQLWCSLTHPNNCEL